MGVSQIIKEDNGNMTTTVTVITDDGNVSVGTFSSNNVDSEKDRQVASVIKDALDKD